MHIVEKSVDTFDNLSTKVLRPHPANYSIHNKKKKNVWHILECLFYNK